MRVPVGLSEIERSPFRDSDDYAFHHSGAILSSRGTSVTYSFGRCGASHASLAVSGPTPCLMRVPVDRRGLSEIERSPFRDSDDYAFHHSGVTLSSRGTSVR
jgi:hypothetical protein